MPDKKFRILLAEDDKFISAAFSEGLTRAGFEVITAYDGIEALEKIRIFRPDLLLLDLLMPRKDGFGVLEDLNREETEKMITDGSYKNMPIIVFSNLEEEDNIRRSRDLGAVEYLIKSNTSMQEVIEKIKKHLHAEDGAEA